LEDDVKNTKSLKAQADKAMPEVKKLVRRYSLYAIRSCVKKLTELEKKRSRISELQSQVATLKREITA
jgi:hypothetical protein